jgi:DNA-binding transcriptional ArsR family regulator
LRIFGLLLREPDLTVSAVAAKLRQPLPVASQYLRALEARGFLSARRAGRRVEYRAGSVDTGRPVGRLVRALQLSFRREKAAADIFKLATAFTHPRRIAIFRALLKRPLSAEQIRRTTGVASPALLRHLRKLESRGFVKRRGDVYALVRRPDPFGRELARLAAAR